MNETLMFLYIKRFQRFKLSPIFLQHIKTRHKNLSFTIIIEQFQNASYFFKTTFFFKLEAQTAF